MENLKLCKSTQEEINIVYNDSYILKALQQDNIIIQPIYHELVTYYSCFNNNEFLGCFMEIKQSNLEIESHSLLLKKGIKYSRKLGYLFLEQCFKKGYERVCTFVISDLIKSVNYLLKMGFSIEGIKRNSASRNGKIINSIMMGILRKEFKKCHR